MYERIILNMICIFIINNCLSIKNRSNDFKDIFVIAVEKKVYGSSFFIWCIGGGIQKTSSGEGYGLRSGYFGKYHTGGLGKIPDYYQLLYAKYKSTYFVSKTNHSNEYGDSNLLYNSQSFTIFEKEVSLRNKLKEYIISNVILFRVEVPNLIKSDDFVKSYGLGLYNSTKYPNCKAPLTTEFSFGIHYGFRIGFNFSEAFDLLVGFVGFDPMDDDYDENGNLPVTKQIVRELTEEEKLEVFKRTKKDFPEEENASKEIELNKYMRRKDSTNEKESK